MHQRAFRGILCALFTASTAATGQNAPLEGTQPLDWTGDIASRLVDGVDKFLLREIEASVERRARHWKRDFSSPDAYTKSVEPNRKRLAKILGVQDERVAFDQPWVRLESGDFGPADPGDVRVEVVRWPAFGDVRAEGLLLMPFPSLGRAAVVAIPDADQTPEMVCGLAPGLPPEDQFALRLARSGCAVLVPALVSRETFRRGNATLTHREYLYRPAFELGRHILGYEIQRVLSGVDWFSREDFAKERLPIGVCGWGEGGHIALCAAALDTRIKATLASGFFDSRLDVWQEPIDRNVFGLLDMFGGAELASLVAPRALVIEAARGPELSLPGKGGAPARLVTPSVGAVRAEVARARKLVEGLTPAGRIDLVESGGAAGPPMTDGALRAFLDALLPGTGPVPPGGPPGTGIPAKDAQDRQARQIHELDRHNQELLAQSPYVRADFLKDLDTSSLEKYAQSVEKYRQIFRDDVIGRFDQKPLPFNARSRQSYDKPLWRGYEVVLDVFPDVIAYGILCLPKDLKPGERRPVVVCQHGLEGRPQDVVTGDNPAYHDFAARLAERGFITFAPQNLYIFGDRFRSLQRKANPLGKTLFSIIVPQHQQIVDWLKTQPFVDPQRIGFYGLSYGGKSAMRIPPLVTDYCLSICSADFNEWVWKNASTVSPYSYVWTGEYEIFEFDLGSTFNYAEMAALIAPRPFMVERGHFDGVAPDETVGYEYAKIRYLYEAKLGIGDRTEIEWFVGPHTINGKGTFDFLHKHLKWPKR